MYLGRLANEPRTSSVAVTGQCPSDDDNDFVDNDSEVNVRSDFFDDGDLFHDYSGGLQVTITSTRGHGQFHLTRDRKVGRIIRCSYVKYAGTAYVLSNRLGS